MNRGWVISLAEVPSRLFERNPEAVRFVNKMLRLCMAMECGSITPEKLVKEIKKLLRKLKEMDNKEFASAIYPILMRDFIEQLPEEMANRLKEECLEALVDLELSF